MAFVSSLHTAVQLSEGRQAPKYHRPKWLGPCHNAILPQASLPEELGWGESSIRGESSERSRLESLLGRPVYNPTEPHGEVVIQSGARKCTAFLKTTHQDPARTE